MATDYSTFENALDAITAKGYRWKLTGFQGSCIRRAGIDYLSCPVAALMDAETDDYLAVAHGLGMPEDVAERIAEAADGSPLYDGDREALRSACGLDASE